jgi:MYXO-CTERM domain-containing protein
VEGTQGTVRAAVKRSRAETYLLISLAAFAGSVIVTRLFLALTGYPQIGNSVLHIAHALWGALLLLVAVLLPLTLANGWAFTVSALLSGLGVGLFIDEVGKFITQANDYFFPPAAPVIYAFFLLLVLLYLFVRRRRHPDPRAELYRALAGLHELVDNNLDTHELETLLARLEVARRADQPHVAGLAGALHTYLDETDIPLLPARPGRWRRFTAALDRWGRRLGRRRHRALILVAMALLGLGTLAAVGLLLYLVLVPQAVRQSMLTQLVTEGELHSLNAGFWLYLRIFLQGLVGLVALAAIRSIREGREQQGINAALLALLLSLTGVVLLSFYLDQFRAVVTALLQFGVLLLVLAYRRWYLKEGEVDIRYVR